MLHILAFMYCPLTPATALGASWMDFKVVSEPSGSVGFSFFLLCVCV